MQTPQWINERYKILTPLGQGGTSTVYTAIDTRHPDRIEVAIKIIGRLTLDDGDYAIRQTLFHREVLALQTLTHTGIVQLLDHGYDRETGLLYIVLEYLEKARTLHDRVPEWKPELADSLDIMIELLDAIAYAHQSHIIHRDLNPRNVLMSQGFVKLIDFGVSKILGDLTAGQTVNDLFTRPYASPEQLSYDDVEAASDIYSLAAIFYFLCTHRHPSGTRSLSDQIHELTNIPLDVRTVAMMMAHTVATERPRSAARVLLDFRRIREQLQQQSQHVYLVLTNNALTGLFKQGVIDTQQPTQAIKAVQQALAAGSAMIPLHDENGYDLLGDTMSFRCTLADENNAFIIRSIQAKLAPHILERRRQDGVVVPAQWKVLAPGFPVPSATSRLSGFLDEIDEAAHLKMIARDQRERRKDLVETWRRILEYDKEMRESSLKKVAYHELTFHDRDMLIQMRLTTDLDLNTLFASGQILEIEAPNIRPFSVGRFLHQDGEHVFIARFSDVKLQQIPIRGKIAVEGRQWAAAWRRQRWALDTIVDQRCINPRLPDVLIHPALAQGLNHDRIIETFFNADLDQPKQMAVRAALASRDVFLIQGPPGTGKTVLITEMIAQILHHNPSARILLVSQSNIAIDNVLAGVGALIPDRRMVRVGREENVSGQAEKYLVYRRVDAWADHVKERVKNYLATEHTPTAARRDLTTYHELIQTLLDLMTRIPAPKRMQNANLRAGIEILKQRFPDLTIAMTESSLTLVRTEIEHQIQAMKNPIEIIIEDWLKKVGRSSDFEKTYLQVCSVIAGTCVGIVGQRDLPDRFEWTIIDEAGRATPSEVLISMVRAERSILVGDHKQLPPIIDHELREELRKVDDIDPMWFDQSLFEYLYNRLESSFKTVLQMQYRMHPHIANLIGSVFYPDEGLQTGVTADRRIHGWARWPYAVVWYSTSKLSQRTELSIESEGKYCNFHEAKIIDHQLTDLEQALRAQSPQGGRKEVAVIAGYSNQVELLRRQLTVDDKERWTCLDIEVNTVDAFQGSERDIVFYSVVRSNARREIGFLRDFRRLNVALSRARELLFIVGDHAMVVQADTKGYPNPFPEIITYILAHPQECLLWSPSDDL